MKKRHQPWLRIAGAVAVLSVLLAVFGLYTRPEFMRGLADQIWSCF